MIDSKKFMSVEFFNFLLKMEPLPDDFNIPFIYKVYVKSVSDVTLVINKNKNIEAMTFNPLCIYNYIVAEYDYTAKQLTKEQIVNLQNDINFILGLSGEVVDKYLTLEHLYYTMPRTNNKYYPPLSSIDLYTNYVLHLLDARKQNEPPMTLLNDMYYKFFSMIHCIVGLLSNGYETEALSTWRTLHETECILIILTKYPESIPAYMRHITYNLAFRNTIPNKEEQDAIFVEIKEKMKARGLKSKDMKRFIENGWILSIDKFDKDENVKLNFRNGLQYAAGLEANNSWYEMSSEIAHSSPLLIYSNKDFFFDMTVVAIYSSFLNIEQMFMTHYLASASEVEKANYLKTRSIRLKELENLYKIEEARFSKENNE